MICGYKVNRNDSKTIYLDDVKHIGSKQLSTCKLNEGEEPMSLITTRFVSVFLETHLYTKLNRHYL